MYFSEVYFETHRSLSFWEHGKETTIFETQEYHLKLTLKFFNEQRKKNRELYY